MICFNESRELEFIEAGYTRHIENMNPMLVNVPYYIKKFYNKDNAKMRYYIKIYEFDFRESKMLPKHMCHFTYNIDLKFNQKKDQSMLNINLTLNNKVSTIAEIEDKVEELFTVLDCQDYDDLF